MQERNPTTSSPGIPAVVVTSNVVDTKVQCMVQTSKHILIGKPPFSLLVHFILDFQYWVLTTLVKLNISLCSDQHYIHRDS